MGKSVKCICLTNVCVAAAAAAAAELCVASRKKCADRKKGKIYHDIIFSSQPSSDSVFPPVAEDLLVETHLPSK